MNKDFVLHYEDFDDSYNDIKSEEKPVSVWERLKTADKPIVMYGMGDGAEKIMRVMETIGVKPAAFMASDEFVRGHDFLGYRVKKLSDIEAEFEDFIIIVCFGTCIPDVMERLYALSEKHELYAPDVPVIGGGLFDSAYAEMNAEKIAEVRKILADEVSRFVFDKWLEYRISGKIQPLSEMALPKAEALAHLKLGKNETYVDLGAYNGDTIEEFLGLTDREFKKIYAVEPDAKSFDRLRRRHYLLPQDKLCCVNAVSWECDTELEFHGRAGRNSAIEGKGRTIITPARSVDSILGGEKATYIKMDVEGCEKQSILGAEKTIRKCKPKLNIALYHRTEDMLELPLLIKRIEPSYKLLLRHHPYIPAWDTNLYCF